MTASTSGCRRIEVDDQRADLGAQEMVGAGGAERRQLGADRLELTNSSTAG